MIAASFTNSISLGVVLVSVLIVILYAISTWRDKRGERWKDLYELADQERKEVQQALANCTNLVTEQKATIARLDAMSMPIKIVELMNESVRRIDEQARERLDTSLELWRKDREAHENLDRERHKALFGLLNELKGLLLRMNGPGLSGPTR